MSSRGKSSQPAATPAPAMRRDMMASAAQQPMNPASPPPRPDSSSGVGRSKGGGGSAQSRPSMPAPMPSPAPMPHASHYYGRDRYGPPPTPDPAPLFSFMQQQAMDDNMNYSYAPPREPMPVYGQNGYIYGSPANPSRVPVYYDPATNSNVYPRGRSK